jgi:hypothetical protein
MAAHLPESLKLALFTSLLVPLVASQAGLAGYGNGGGQQDYMYDRERFRAACPDYSAYSKYGQ